MRHTPGPKNRSYQNSASKDQDTFRTCASQRLKYRPEDPPPRSPKGLEEPLKNMQKAAADKLQISRETVGALPFTCSAQWRQLGLKSAKAGFDGAPKTRNGRGYQRPPVTWPGGG